MIKIITNNSNSTSFQLALNQSLYGIFKYSSPKSNNELVGAKKRVKPYIACCATLSKPRDSE